MKRKERAAYIAGLLLVLLLAYLFSQTVFGTKLNRIFSDKEEDAAIRNEVVIVGIDDASLASLGAWPWKRDIFAKTINRLYEEGARVIAFDILFLEKREGDKDVENVLLANKKPVVFASKIDQNGAELTSVYSGNPYAKSALANVYPDDDGKVRTLYFYRKDQAGDCIETLSFAAYLLYTKKTSVCDTEGKPFLYQGTLPRMISIADVVSGKEIGDIANKIILIGSASLDLEDHFVSLAGPKIPGVYVHGSMVASMLNNSFPKSVPAVAITILILLLLSYGSYISLRLNTILLQALFLVLGLLFLVVLALASSSLGYRFSFSFPMLSLLLTSIYGFMFRYRITEGRNAHIRSLFGKFVHKDVLKELMQSGEGIRLGGEKRDVTVLFSDIRGFTTFSETMSPEELTNLLNNYLSAMTPHILNEHGTIDKFIGDAIMAFWNAPLYIENHTLHAVQAALAMEEELRNFNERHDTFLNIGIGLHAGEVIVGNVGSKERVNYTILGDVVNTGSRLEGLTKKYGVVILVSEDVRKRISDPGITFRKLDVITVKGKHETTTIYEARKNGNFPEGLIAQYEKAFAFYEQGDFDDALPIFTELKGDGDGPSQEMLRRIDAIDKSIWDGVWRFDEK